MLCAIKSIKDVLLDAVMDDSDSELFLINSKKASAAS